MSDGRTQPAARSGHVWGALELEVPKRIAGRLWAALGQGCIGAWSDRAEGDRERRIAYFATPADAFAAARGVEALVRSAEIDPQRCGLRVHEVADARWVERQQASLRPFDVGRGFMIDPTGEGVASPGRVRIPLVPGGAFGTGEHPTTRLCLAELERRVAKGSRWIDLGCGSAILAVVAAHCGAGEVLALDVDPQAVRVAREVVARNGMEDRVRVEQGTQEVARPAAWEGVVANIATSFLVEKGKALAGLLRPGGTLIASGFPAGELDEVRRALEPHRLPPVATGDLDDWGLLVCASSGTER